MFREGRIFELMIFQSIFLTGFSRWIFILGGPSEITPKLNGKASSKTPFVGSKCQFSSRFVGDSFWGEKIIELAGGAQSRAILRVLPKEQEWRFGSFATTNGETQKKTLPTTPTKMDVFKTPCRCASSSKSADAPFRKI